jgi:Zn-finger nucleic acid-binding protein
MVAYREQEGALWDCPACEAQFVEHRLLQCLLAGRQRLPDATAKKPVPLPLNTTITYYPCPHCAHLMNRRNFGGRSGIVVDVCASHGVWFEAGELKLVLEFVESGALAEARRIGLGLPPPSNPNEQQHVASAIARSLGEPRTQSAHETPSDRWVRWAEARLDELVRLYLSWSRR